MPIAGTTSEITVVAISAIRLTPAAVAELQFTHGVSTSGNNDDVLVFANGDQLRGMLETVADGRLQWRMRPDREPTQFDMARIAGVQFTPRKQEEAARHA